MSNVLTFLNLNQNELRLAVAGNLAGPPASPKAGQFYFDTALGSEYVWNGTTWVATDASKLPATIPNTALAPSALNRANQNGVQLANTISNLQTTVLTYTLDTFATPVADVSLGSHKITNLAAPVAGTDAANMAYVLSQAQSSAAGIVSKQAVAVVSTANQATLSGLLTIDGVTLTAGTRVLLVGQTTATQNGVYIAGTGAWTRSANDTNGELDLGATWFVEQGTTYASSTWRLGSPTSGTITAGTTAVTITQLTAAFQYTGSNGITIVGNNFTGVVLAGGGILASAGGFQVDTTVVARKYSTTIGDGSTLVYTITHNLGTVDVIAAIRDQSGNAVITDWDAATTTTITVTFSVAPTAGQYRVTVLG